MVQNPTCLSSLHTVCLSVRQWRVTRGAAQHTVLLVYLYCFSSTTTAGFKRNRDKDHRASYIKRVGFGGIVHLLQRAGVPRQVVVLIAPLLRWLEDALLSGVYIMLR